MKLALPAGLLAALCLSPSLARAQWNQPQQPPPAGQQPSGMQAGGLAPPSSMPSEAPPPKTSTEEQLEDADEKDSGRGLEFVWLNGELGYEWLGLQTFRAKNLVNAQLVKENDSGLMWGAGLGVRLVFITLGARFRLGNFNAWDLWTLNAELGIRIPLGSVEPYFTFGGGYASAGSFSSDSIGSSVGVEIKGYNLRGGGGLDIYVTDAFSIGASLTGEMLFLTRPGVDPAKLGALGSGSGSGSQAQIDAKTQEVYKADGSSIGAGVTLNAVAGLHF